MRNVVILNLLVLFVFDLYASNQSSVEFLGSVQGEESFLISNPKYPNTEFSFAAYGFAEGAESIDLESQSNSICAILGYEKYAKNSNRRTPYKTFINQTNKPRSGILIDLKRELIQVGYGVVEEIICLNKVDINKVNFPKITYLSNPIHKSSGLGLSGAKGVCKYFGHKALVSYSSHYSNKENVLELDNEGKVLSLENTLRLAGVWCIKN